MEHKLSGNKTKNLGCARVWVSSLEQSIIYVQTLATDRSIFIIAPNQKLGKLQRARAISQMSPICLRIDGPLCLSSGLATALVLWRLMYMILNASTGAPKTNLKKIWTRKSKEHVLDHQSHSLLEVERLVGVPLTTTDGNDPAEPRSIS